jgi:hypothetical protein
MDNIFDKDREDKYDSQTTLSFEMGYLVNGLPPESKTMLAEKAIRGEQVQGLTKIIGGFVCIAIGIVLIFLGANNVFNFDITIGKISAKLVNATPGIFLSLLGFFIVILSGQKIKK